MRAFRLAYDGRSYLGFQRQPDVPTVEGVLLDGLRDLDLLGPQGAPPSGYAAAGRTDAGVSAVAQAIAFESPDWCTPRVLDGALPAGVHTWAAADVPDDFHATHDATRRAYVHHLPAAGVDFERASVATERLSGAHDFHNLTSDDGGAVRDLEVTVERDGDFLVLKVASDGFPRHLVRRLATLLDEVARDETSLGFIDRVLASEPLDGPDGIPPAPPEGLLLVEVDYPGVTFVPDEEAVAAARETFEEVVRTARTTARTAGRVIDGLG